MKKRDILFFASINYILSFSTVYGYIDPGTGGMLLGSLGTVITVAAAIIGGFLARYLIKPLKRIINKITDLI